MSNEPILEEIPDYVPWSGKIYNSPAGLAKYYANLRGYKLEIILAKLQGISEFVCLLWVVFVVMFRFL